MYWAARPPEANSAALWCGPGAGTFFTAASVLAEVAAQIVNILGGHTATAGALGTAWADPTGELAVAADVPHQLWLGDAAAQIGLASSQISAAGVAFEAARAATPTPFEVAANQLEHGVLLACNFLGILTPLIIANRMRYFGDYWLRSATNMYTYADASAATVGAIAPLPVPLPAVAPVSLDPGSVAQLASQKDVQQAIQSAQASLQAPLNAIAPLAAPVATGLIEFAPSMLPMAAQLPMMAMSPVMQLTSQMAGMAGMGGLSGAGAHGAGAAEAGGLFSAASAAPGPVSAALSSGGAGAGGVGVTGPVSWASRADAAAPAAESENKMGSRIAEAREASTRPATSAGMGTSGVMAPPAARDSASEDSQQRSDALAAAAVLYREPTEIPVVTGAGGARFAAGEGDR